MATGLDVQVGYGVETTVGTPVTPNKFMEVTPPLGLKINPTFTKSQGIRAGRVMPHAKGIGPTTINGPITHELTAETVGTLFRALVDGSPATTGAGPYTHVFTPDDDDKSMTIQVALPSSSAIHPITYAGCRPKSWSISVDPASVFPKLTIEWMAQSYDVDGTPSLTAATFATFTRFTFAHATFSVAGSAVCVDKIEINGTTGWSEEHMICATNPGMPTLKRDTGLMVTGAATGDLAALTQLGRLLAGTEVALSVVFNAGASAQLTLAGNVYFTGDMATVENTGKIKEPLAFEFLSLTSDAAAFTATIISTDVTV